MRTVNLLRARFRRALSDGTASLANHNLYSSAAVSRNTRLVQGFLDGANFVAAHIAAYKEAYSPIGILENEAAAEIAKMRWGLKRASSQEDSIFSMGHLDYADDMQSGHAVVDSCLAEGRVWKEQSHNLILISLYETRLRRAVEKHMAALQDLQEKRKAGYSRAQDEAIRLLQLALSQAEDYDPGDDFVPASAHGQFFFQPPIWPA